MLPKCNIYVFESGKSAPVPDFAVAATLVVQYHNPTFHRVWTHDVRFATLFFSNLLPGILDG